MRFNTEFCAKETLKRFLHDAKQSSPITSALAGISISLRDWQSQKAQFPMRFNTEFCAKETLKRFWHNLKQSSPISSTLAGISISLRDWQS